MINGGFRVKQLNGKRVLITGGARGIGYAIAQGFAREGSHIFLTDIDEALVNESAKALANEYGVQVSAFVLDVSSCESISRVFSKIGEAFETLDVLVNNAGIQIRDASISFSEASWDKLMDINLKGSFFCAQAAARLMENGGAIVNISSGTATRTLPGRAPYVISKAAIGGMTAVLAAEWASRKIRVNAVAPGWIRTQLLEDGFRLGVVSEKQIFAAVPYKRLAEVDEIADAVVYLGSGEASYVTGQTLYVDGGWSALGLPDLTQE
jgi:NAD(P)-dependent dehydrogenase (short-subunit alcohol dehydrogenase family)